MKARCVTVVVVAVIFWGCGVDVLTTTAVTGELRKREAQTAVNVLKHVKQQTSQLSVDEAIDTYYAEKGYYPPSLEALVPEYLPAVPLKPDGSEYGYNPATGQLLDEPTASGGSDEEKMERIRQAIVRYGQDTGYYPPSLEALVPYYLARVPTSSSGHSFVYYPQNGALYHPEQLMEQRRETRRAPTRQQATARPARRRGGVGAGAGPMGEVMTGIAVQGELNRMSTAGARSAGSRARHGVNKTADEHTERQQKVLDEFGF